MTTAALERTRGERFGWIFAAVWLFYLLDTVSALISQPSMPWRVIGLIAVALFGITYLMVVGYLAIATTLFGFKLGSAWVMSEPIWFGAAQPRSCAP